MPSLWTPAPGLRRAGRQVACSEAGVHLPGCLLASPASSEAAQAAGLRGGKRVPRAAIRSWRVPAVCGAVCAARSRSASPAGRRPDLGDLGVIPLSWKASISACYLGRRGLAVLRPSLAPSLYSAHFPARFRFVSSSGDDARPQLRGLSHPAPRDPRSPVRWGRPLTPPCYPGGARTSATSSHLALQVTVVRRTLVFVVVVIG